MRVPARSEEQGHVAGRGETEQGILEAEDKEACTDSTEMSDQKGFNTVSLKPVVTKGLMSPAAAFYSAHLKLPLNFPDSPPSGRWVGGLFSLSPSLAASPIRLFFAPPWMPLWLALLCTQQVNLGLVTKLRSCLGVFASVLSAPGWS